MNGMHGIIFTYERRNDLRELTALRSPASIPFGGRYRAIDFALSNMVNAGVSDVGVVLYGRYQSLLDHLGSGKNWDLSRKRGGLKLLPPCNQSGNDEQGFRGKMGALAGIRSYLREIRQDYVVLTDGDLVANLPLEDIFQEHLRTRADITAVCGADCFAVADGTYLELDETGRVTDAYYHLNTPKGQRCLETYILSTALLLELVDQCATHDLYSFRRDVLQAYREKLNIRGFIWNEYAAQIRSVQEYYDRSMQLLQPEIRRELFCPQRPIQAKNGDLASSYFDPESSCVNSLVGDGCRVEGRVENSILFPGVTVEKGASVRNCILFKAVKVGANTSLEHIIADKYVEIMPTRTLIGHGSYPLVIGKGSRI